MQRLILTSNKFEAIPFPDTDTIPMHGIKHLALAHNSIQAWPDIDSLSLWLPALETLSLSGNPLVEGAKLVNPSLTSLLLNCRLRRHGNRTQCKAVCDR